MLSRKTADTAILARQQNFNLKSLQKTLIKI